MALRLAVSKESNQKDTAMQRVLTSWKEIAQYMGKGVRTVQRWEKCFGLPVRRPTANSHKAILAVPEEIDGWVRIKTEARSTAALTPETEQLRKRLLELEQENQLLRGQLGMDLVECRREVRENNRDPGADTRLVPQTESFG